MVDQPEQLIDSSSPNAAMSTPLERSFTHALKAGPHVGAAVDRRAQAQARELCDLEQFILIIVHGGGTEEVCCDDDDPHLQW
jgi:hypothetical protein